MCIMVYNFEIKLYVFLTDSQRALIIIGDSRPHEPEEYIKEGIRRKYEEAFEIYNWKNEADKLFDKVIQCCPSFAIPFVLVFAESIQSNMGAIAKLENSGNSLH